MELSTASGEAKIQRRASSGRALNATDRLFVIDIVGVDRDTFRQSALRGAPADGRAGETLASAAGAPAPMQSAWRPAGDEADERMVFEQERLLVTPATTPVGGEEQIDHHQSQDELGYDGDEEEE